jgi:hypothetical protein
MQKFVVHPGATGGGHHELQTVLTLLPEESPEALFGYGLKVRKIVI